MVQRASMRNFIRVPGAVALVLAVALGAGCGDSSSLNSPDPYMGAVDATGLEGKFLPITSAASTALKNLCQSPPAGLGLTKTSLPCYPAQVGYSQGKRIK